MKNKKSKVGLWSALTAITAILTIAAIVGNIIANQYATTINVALNASTYQIIHDSSNTEDTEYFKKALLPMRSVRLMRLSCALRSRPRAQPC